MCKIEVNHDSDDNEIIPNSDEDEIVPDTNQDNIVPDSDQDEDFIPNSGRDEIGQLNLSDPLEYGNNNSPSLFPEADVHGNSRPNDIVLNTPGLNKLVTFINNFKKFVYQI